MKKIIENNTIQFGGFNWSEHASLKEYVQKHRLYKGLGMTRYDFVQFADAQKPFVCLWSTDPVWIDGMRRILKSSPRVREINRAYDLKVRLQVLPPVKPEDGFLAAGWYALIQELLPCRDVEMSFSC